MCSIEDGEDVMLQKPADIVPGGRTCMKCDKPAVVIIRMNDAMCGECFTSYATHKFRSAFGKSKLIRDQERVIVAYSGGCASSAMINLIQGGLSKRAQKKLRFIPSLVYIDEGAVMKQSMEGRHSNLQEITRLMKVSDLPYTTYCLEQAMDSDVEDVASEFPACSDSKLQHLPCVWSSKDQDITEMMERLKLNEPASNQLSSLLDNMKSLSAKENLVRMMRLRLLATVAKHQGVTKVLLGDCATRLSVRLLSNISQGQGAHLPYELSFADNRYNEVTFIRPLREFTAKEVAIYNSLCGVDSCFIPNLSTKTPAHASIERLTEEFISGLQAEYPNTVSTVFRTGEKFDLSQKSVVKEETCCMCHCPLDTSVGLSSAMSAIKFSQALCSSMASRTDLQTPVTEDQTGCSKEAASCHRSGVDDCCGQGDGSCSTSAKTRMTHKDLEPFLCYGCQLIARDMMDVNRLPGDVLFEVNQRARRQQMKNSIADYLIDQ